MSSNAMLEAHMLESDDRNRELHERIDHLVFHHKERFDKLDRRGRELADNLDANTAELVSMRNVVTKFGSLLALQRATGAVESARTAAAIDPSHTGKFAALSLDGVAGSIASLGLWRARPSLVVAFVGSLLALAVSFGLPISHEQRTAILAVLPLMLGVVASMRGEKTKKALVNAALLKGASTPPSDPPKGF